MITLISLLSASLAQAGVCDDLGGLPTGPISASLYDGDHGLARRTCGRTEAALDGGGLVLADTPNFYGHIVAGGNLEGAYATDKLEVFGGVQAIRYDSVISAISSSYVGLGHTHLGASYRLAESESWAVGLSGRAVLPTAFGLYENARPFGLDLGVNGVWVAAPALRVHGQLGGLHSFATGPGDADPRFGLGVLAGAELRPSDHFAAVVDLEAFAGQYAPLDAFSAGIGLRAGGEAFGLELGAKLPLAGRERALATAGLRASWRF